MPNALIFSPNMDGHRQVYAFVMAHILEEAGLHIYVATNSDQHLANSFYINKLKEKSSITLLDTRHYAEGGIGISLPEFTGLQAKNEIDLTIFTEADHHLSLFISQIFRKKSRLRGRVIGIFMRPFYFYRKSGIINKLRFLKHFPSRWKKDEQLFFDFMLPVFSLLDTAFTIDENFVSHHSNFRWLPDMFQQYAELIIHPDEKSGQRIWMEKLDEFKVKNGKRSLLFYFGTAQYRRGYDILLKLAEETESCFIHCGLGGDDDRFDSQTTQIMSSLSNKGRLFMTNEYIEDPLCIEHFFKSISHLVLPYRNFFGSSGVMLQALSFGIPVLSPDNGIIGHRINNFHLGATYPENDMAELITQFKKFRETNTKLFANDIQTYMNFQTTGQLKDILLNAFTGTTGEVRQPVYQNL